jgi:hypothetical protein
MRRDVAFLPIARTFYREQLRDWHLYWGDWPDADTKSIFKNRAWSDAWATYRHAITGASK